MTILGLDLSLTSTGHVLLRKGKVLEQRLIKSKPDGKLPIDELKRLIEIKEQVMSSGVSINLVVIEGLAFMARNSRSLVQLSALNYMIRESLYREDIPFLIVAPATLKKFVTSRGNAKKDEMLLEVYKRWGFSTNSTDISDAYGLAKIGESIFDRTILTTKEQKECISILEGQIK